MPSFWWTQSVHADVLCKNINMICPWMGSDVSRSVVGIDIDTTGFKPIEVGKPAHRAKNYAWRIGLTTAESTPEGLVNTESGEILFNVPREAMANSFEVREMARLTGCEREDALDAVMVAIDKAPNVAELVPDLRALLTSRTVCSQTTSTFDGQWLSYLDVWRNDDVIDVVDTGMLLKSAAIPTYAHPDESVDLFYSRVYEHRLNGFKYSVDKFVVPELKKSGVLEPPADIPVTRSSAWDSYASLVMLQQMRLLVATAGR